MKNNLINFNINSLLLLYLMLRMVMQIFLNNNLKNIVNRMIETFKTMFGLSDIKDKQATIDLYNKQFDKIQESYRKSNNAF